MTGPWFQRLVCVELGKFSFQLSKYQALALPSQDVFGPGSSLKWSAQSGSWVPRPGRESPDEASWTELYKAAYAKVQASSPM